VLLVDSFLPHNCPFFLSRYLFSPSPLYLFFPRRRVSHGVSFFSFCLSLRATSFLFPFFMFFFDQLVESGLSMSTPPFPSPQLPWGKISSCVRTLDRSFLFFPPCGCGNLPSPFRLLLCLTPLGAWSSVPSFFFSFPRVLLFPSLITGWSTPSETPFFSLPLR